MYRRSGVRWDRADPGVLPRFVAGLVAVAVVGVVWLPGLAGGRTLSGSGSRRDGSVARVGDLTLHGHAASNTFVVAATGRDRGVYTIDGGRPVPFSGIRSLTIDGVGGRDVCRIVNPRGGLFAPPGGIACNGGNRSGPRRGVLEVVGGRSSGGTYSVSRPGAGALTHRLGQTLQVIRFTGLAPITDTVPSPSFIFSPSSTPGDTIEVINGPLVSGTQTMTLQSLNGDFESISFANKTSATVNATTASGDSVELAATVVSAGLSSLEAEASGLVTLQHTSLSGVAVHLVAGGALSGTGNPALTAPSLAVNASGAIGAGSALSVDVGSLAASGTSVNVDDTGALTVADLSGIAGVSATSGDATILASGNVSFSAPVSASGIVRLGSASGSLTQTAAGSIAGGGLAAVAMTGIALTSPGNAVDGPFSANDSTSGAVVFDNGASTLTIGSVAGSSGFATTSGVSSPGALQLEGAGGFDAASTGAVSAATLDLVDLGASGRPWTIAPDSVTDGSGAAIPYTGVTTLTVTGASASNIFDVSASPTTTYSLLGGGGPDSTLNYDAQGRAVSGAISPPTGEINSPAVQPVSFTGMAKINVLDQPPPTTPLPTTLIVTDNGSGTVTGTGGIRCPGTCSANYATGAVVALTATPAAGSELVSWSGGGCSGTGACTVTMSASQAVTATFAAIPPPNAIPPPTCTLEPKTHAVSLAKRKRGKRTPVIVGTLALVARCDQAATVTLTGKLIELVGHKPKHGRQRTRTFPLAKVERALSANAATVLVLSVPTAALRALERKAAESASFTLTATNAAGSSHASARITAVRAAR